MRRSPTKSAVLTVELSGKRAYLNEQHPEVQDLVGRIEELERQRLAIERGQEVAELGVRFGLNAVPALSIELRRLEREAERQGEMYDPPPTAVRSRPA